MEHDNKLTVFENENNSDNDIDFGVNQGRPRALLIAGAGAALLLGVLIVALVMTKPSIDQESENMVRAGSPEFDAYKNKVVLEIDPDSRMVYPNMIGMWTLRAKAKLSNLGDRELASVEVIGKLIDYEDKVIAQAVKLPVPRDNPGPLKPGESYDISIGVDAPSKVTEAEVKNITIELRGLRFR
jgi:hypothetical protein